MAYVSLYRKYRPQTFDDVVGQEHVTRTLANAIAEDRLHHAYLFTGPRGTGKTSTARILAKAINCEEGPTASPCNTCRQCVEITDGSSVDVIELDMASHGGVDDARELRDRALFAPASARRKIYILDEVHMASNAAFNALLKMIEEPPEHVMFAMATTDPQKVLPTIMSRVQRLDLRRVSAADVAGNVRRLCEAEGYRIEDGAVEAIVRAGDGSLRDTQSVLEQVLAYAGTEVTADAVQQVLGATPTEKVAEVVDQLAARNVAGLLAGVQRLVDEGHDLRRFTLDLVGHVRDLLVLGAAPDHPDLVDATDERRRLLQEQATTMPADTLLRAVRVLSETVTEQRLGSPRLPLELALATLVVPSESAQLEELTDRLARLEAGAFPSPATATPQTPPPAGEPTSAGEAAIARSEDADRRGPTAASAGSEGDGPASPARRSAAMAAASLEEDPEVAVAPSDGAATEDPQPASAEGLTPQAAKGLAPEVAEAPTSPTSPTSPDAAGAPVVDDPGPSDPEMLDPGPGEAGPDVAAEDRPGSPPGSGGSDRGEDVSEVSSSDAARSTDETITQGDGDTEAEAQDASASLEASTSEPSGADAVSDASSDVASGPVSDAGAGSVSDAAGGSVSDAAGGSMSDAADGSVSDAGSDAASGETDDAPADELALITQRWEAVLDVVREGSRRHHAVFAPAKPVRAGRGILTLRYGRRYASFHAANAGGGDYASAMQQAIENVCGLRMRLEIVVEGDDDRRRPLPQSLTPDDARTAVLHGDDDQSAPDPSASLGSDTAEGRGPATSTSHRGQGEDGGSEEEIDVREAEASVVAEADPEQVGRLLADELGAELVDERRPSGE